MGLRGTIAGACGLLAVAFAVPAVAQALPFGSYLTSCREAVLQGDTLIAVCSAPGGVWVAARLENAAYCIGDIYNQGGALSCMRASTVFGFQTPAARAARAMPPAGSYMGGCRNIRLDDGWLKAECADRAGRWMATSIVANWCGLLGQDIANMDGRLGCR